MSANDQHRRDAEHWDDRYTNSAPPVRLRPPELISNPPGFAAAQWRGLRALDVACGWGDAGLFLAGAGADVTLLDVSAVALQTVTERADADHLSVSTIQSDLTCEPLPDGPWDVVTCAHYLDRKLLPRLGAALTPDGRLLVAIATTTNLERHQRPSARFLLEPNELPTLVPDLVVKHHSEAWRTNGVHEAWLIARPSYS